MLLFLRISVLLLSVLIRDVKGGGGGGQGDHNMGKKRACMHAGRENKACRSTSEREENTRIIWGMGHAVWDDIKILGHCSVSVCQYVCLCVYKVG